MNQSTIEFNNDVILVVAGDPISLSVKSELLQRDSYRVIKAESGSDALAIATVARPALVLLDSTLKDVGFDLCRRLKTQTETQFIKVLQTSRPLIGAHEQIREPAVGADAYLIEPAEEEEIRATVRVLLKLAEQEHKNQQLIERLSDAQRTLLESTQAFQSAREITANTHTEVVLSGREAQLAAEFKALASLNEACSRLWRSNRLQEGLEEMLAASIELLGADMGNVQLVSPEREVLTIAAQKGFDGDFLAFFREVSAKDDSACGRALRNEARIVIPDVDIDPAYAPLRQVARRAGYRAVQSTPLIARGGRPLGVLSTHWRTIHVPCDQDLRRFDVYVRQAADFIERCGLEDELRISEARFRTMAQAVPSLLFEIDAIGWNTWTSDGWCRFTGQTPEQAAGHGWTEALHPEDRAANLKQWLNCMENGLPFESKQRLHRIDGTYAWVIARALPIRDGQGHVTRWVGSVTDVDAIIKADEEQKRLAEIVESSADAIIGKDLQGIITNWNHGAETLLGYTEREILGRPVTLLFPPDREEEEQIILARLRAGESIRHYETVRRCKDGRDICVSLTISPIRGQAGTILGASKIMRDITDRKRAEAALHESEGRLRLFIEHAPAGVAMFDREMRYLAATRRWKTDYHLPHDVEGHSHYEYFPNLPDKWMEAHRRGLAGEVLRAKADPFNGCNGTTQWVTWEIRPWYQAPGTVGGILIGADEVTTEVLAQQALRESEARLQAIMDRAPAAIFIRDRDGRSLFMNEACARVMGFDHTQVQGKTEYELYPAELAEQFRRNDQMVWKSGQAHVFEEYVPHSDGVHTYVSNKFLLCDAEGTPYALCGIASDITSRRRMEDALRESEERLRLALEGAELGSWDVVLSSGKAIWNRRHALMQGYAPADQPYTMAQWQDRIHPEDLETVLTTLEEARQTHASFAVEHRVCLPRTGTVRWLSLYGRFSYDDSGKPVRISGVSLDITERKQSEEALRQAELRFQTMAHSAPVLIWQTDSAGVIFLNQHYLQFVGETLEGVKATGWTHYLHPEDKEAYLAAYRTAFEKQSPYESKCRFRRYDGQYRWFKTAGMPLYGADETFHGFVGCSVDITDIMIAKQALLESEERFRQLSTSLPLLAWTCSPDGSCDFLSQQWVAYTGIPESPRGEFSWLEQLHPHDGPRTMEAWNSAVQGTADDFHVEFRLRRHDGLYRWFDTKAVRARDDRGRTIKWYGFSTDITERKLAEEGLQEAHERLRHWNVELEQAVQEKTQELQQSQNHLRAMATELNLAEQRERKRLATDLHDHLQQMLVAGKIMIGQGRRAAEDISAYEAVLKKLDGILSDALTYSRTLVAELSPPVVRDHGLAASLKWLAEYMLKYHDLTVTVIVPEDEKFKLPDNHVILLFQSTRELLINSAKHAGTGQAILLMEEEADQLRITLKDDGKGFDPATAGLPYGESSLKFGLFSIKERMRALGGSLIIDSAPGRGTTATLVLPLAKKDEGIVEKNGDQESRNLWISSERPPAHTGFHPGAIRVLLVDDHAMVRQGLHSMLDAYMDIHVVGEAKDGAEAIKSVEELMPHVVVMDINMPRMNGIEATKHITHLHPDIIVIGISVNIGEGNMDAMQRAGAVTLLTKEAAVEQLYTTIQEAVKNRTPLRL